MTMFDDLSHALTYTRPTGAFYFFVNLSRWLSSHGMSDTDFCKQLLSECHVGIVPGSAFGMKNFVRISYATSMENLEKALSKMRNFLSR